MKHTVAPSISPSSPPSTSSARVRPRTPVAVAFSLALASVSVLAGCPGTLEGNFPPVGGDSGSGGSSSGSGGMTGSGGSGSGGSGSGGSGSGSGGSMAACDAPTMIFKDKCARSGCHGPGGQPPDLSGANPETRLIGKPGLECGNYLDSTKPASGEVIKKISGTTCITQMPPPPDDPLTPDQIKCVTDWANSVIP